MVGSPKSPVLLLFGKIFLPLQISRKFKMTNKPLSSSDLSKLLVFALLLIPTLLLFGIGVIPTIFLVFGLVMMKKNADFSHIETAARNYRILLILAVVGCLASAAYWQYQYSVCMSTSEQKWSCYDDSTATGFFVTALVLAFYIIAMHTLFLKPLRSHRDWVEKNGIFAGKEKSSQAALPNSEVSIIKGEKFKSYSVADELLKWAKLKEEGHITEEQYNEARNKLLQGS